MPQLLAASLQAEMTVPAGGAAAHDAKPGRVEILPDFDRTGIEALVQGLTPAGPLVHVALKLHDGRELSAPVSVEEAELLELEQGQIVSVRLPSP